MRKLRLSVEYAFPPNTVCGYERERERERARACGLERGVGRRRKCVYERVCIDVYTDRMCTHLYAQRVCSNEYGVYASIYT